MNEIVSQKYIAAITRALREYDVKGFGLLYRQFLAEFPSEAQEKLIVHWYRWLQEAEKKTEVAGLAA